jgi:GTP-binding protein Era
MKAAFVGLLGRPSCGKSTLMNRICGHKVSIVSSAPQTTRNRVRGIYNAPEGQLVFIDTPGFHLSDKKMNLYLKELATGTMSKADVLLYLIDVTRQPGQEEHALMELLHGKEQRLIVGLNKIDIGGDPGLKIRGLVERTLAGPRIQAISALTGEGVPELLGAVWALAPEGEELYPEGLYTDQSPDFRIAEIIREKAIRQTRQEVPHSLYVDISDMEMKDDNRYLWVRAFLYVERESQKGILVGKGGERIRTIVRQAEEEADRLFPYPVRLDVRVKTRPKWRKDDTLLKKLIH